MDPCTRYSGHYLYTIIRPYVLRILLNELNCLVREIQGLLADGTVVAVKQLSSKSRQGNREFLNEIGMVSCMNHPNLVKLFGCCIEDDQLLLVYEFMENNSLAQALYGKLKQHDPLQNNE